MFKVKIIKTPERLQWRSGLNIFQTFFSVFIVDFEPINVNWVMKFWWDFQVKIARFNLHQN